MAASSLCISVKLKNLKANHNDVMKMVISVLLCISVKLKNLKANHNRGEGRPRFRLLCISVKLKNLKANHNDYAAALETEYVVYIRKVKKSESKSQPVCPCPLRGPCCVYP